MTTDDHRAAKRIVLGLETSCDETAAAVVASDRTILSHKLLSQIKDHAAYGGVVPEVAARAHVDHLDRLVAEALADAGCAVADLDAIAVTSGPGLIGGLLVGVSTAQSMAWAADKPLIAINHLEGHALSARLTEDVTFPYLLLLVSGGHCQLLIVEGVGRYLRLGSTIDDAAGEAFDKTAKLLGLGYPGGPKVEAWARDGDPTRFNLPRPLIHEPGFNLSFSGLKTAVLRAAQLASADDGSLSDQDKADLCAGFQVALGDCLVSRVDRALDAFVQRYPEAHRQFVVAGGVAANQALRLRLANTCEAKDFAFFAPPQWLCTDNAAMIAWAGVEHRQGGVQGSLDIGARARWPLDEAQAPLYGAGQKGAKV